MLTKITLLGSTGSIGTSALDVVGRWPERFSIFALAAGRNTALLCRQIAEFRPAVAVVADQSGVDELAALLRDAGMRRSQWPELHAGPEALSAVSTAAETGFVLSAIVGVTGLEATYRAICAGKRIGLANKEVLVAGGALVTAAARQHGSEVIPIDSEHNGAHQALRAGTANEVVRLLLTASGGPFRRTPASDLDSVTPEQALNHPTWKMGRRITIDSATLMNKGFEVIEACWLFGLPPEKVDVVVHPQSTVHAMVEYVDGSVLAQLSATDMRMPIQYALTWPERAEAPVPRLSWTEPRTWNFEAPDFERFPLLRLAYDAQTAGGTATCTLNAADEVAVESFLWGRLRFTDIARVVEDTLDRVPPRTAGSVEQILEADRESRAAAQCCVEELAARV